MGPLLITVLRGAAQTLCLHVRKVIFWVKQEVGKQTLSTSNHAHLRLSGVTTSHRVQGARSFL
jgi:hypothetical protein